MRKPVQRMQMPSDGQIVREWGRWRVFVSTKEEYSGCAPERRRKQKDQTGFVNILKEQKPGKSGKRSYQQSIVNDRAGWSLNDKKWALNFRHRNLFLMFKGISLHAWWRQITGVLTRAPVHKRSASFWIFCNGFNRLGDAKKSATIPYSITDLTSDL